MKLTLVTRRNCHLCDEVAHLLTTRRIPFEPADVDRSPELLALYHEAVPVLLADGREICRAPITPASLLNALRSVTG
jgi:glutaredoxin